MYSLPSNEQIKAIARDILKGNYIKFIVINVIGFGILFSLYYFFIYFLELINFALIDVTSMSIILMFAFINVYLTSYAKLCLTLLDTKDFKLESLFCNIRIKKALSKTFFAGLMKMRYFIIGIIFIYIARQLTERAYSNISFVVGLSFIICTFVTSVSVIWKINFHYADYPTSPVYKTIIENKNAMKGYRIEVSKLFLSFKYPVILTACACFIVTIINPLYEKYVILGSFILVFPYFYVSLAIYYRSFIGNYSYMEYTENNDGLRASKYNIEYAYEDKEGFLDNSKNIIKPEAGTYGKEAKDCSDVNMDIDITEENRKADIERELKLHNHLRYVEDCVPILKAEDALIENSVNDVYKGIKIINENPSKASYEKKYMKDPNSTIDCTKPKKSKLQKNDNLDIDNNMEIKEEDELRIKLNKQNISNNEEIDEIYKIVDMEKNERESLEFKRASEIIDIKKSTTDSEADKTSEVDIIF